MMPHPPRSTLFPYTTLFRSVLVRGYDKIPIDGIIVNGETYVDESMLTGESMPAAKKVGDKVIGSAMNILERSEEHTSELQSRPHLVCRLLLEKKKKKI